MTPESCMHLSPVNCLVNYYIFHRKMSYFKRQNSVTDQISKPLEIEDKTNITLVIN